MGTHGESHSRANVDVEDETNRKGAWCMVHGAWFGVEDSLEANKALNL